MLQTSSISFPIATGDFKGIQEKLVDSTENHQLQQPSGFTHIYHSHLLSHREEWLWVTSDIQEPFHIFTSSLQTAHLHACERAG